MRPAYFRYAPDHTFAPVALVRDVLLDVAGQLHRLLVVDNYEHVIAEAAERLSELLAGCQPGLTTSASWTPLILRAADGRVLGDSGNVSGVAG